MHFAAVAIGAAGAVHHERRIGNGERDRRHRVFGAGGSLNLTDPAGSYIELTEGLDKVP